MAALLLIGPITVSAFHYFQKTSGPGLPPMAVFAWGFDSISMVLALWLVARAGLWSTWNGRARVACYIICFTYGRMLFSATQDWLTTSGASFRFPGTRHDDYGRPALDLLSLLMFVLLLTPVVVITRLVLSRHREATKQASRFSISGLVMFTTISAIAFVWIRLLTSSLAPRTYFSHLSQSDAIKEWLGSYLPVSIPELLAAIVILCGLTKQWWVTALVLLAAITLDALGTQCVMTVLEFFTGRQNSSILGRSAVDRWLYVSGRSITVYCAFVTAALMGIRPAFGHCESKSWQAVVADT